MKKIPAAVCAAVLLVTALVAPAQAADEPVLFKWPFSGYGHVATPIMFRTPASGMCLDAALEEIDRDGGKVQLWTCGFGGDEQRWNLEPHPLGGGFQIVSVANGKCLDAALEELEQEVTRLSLWQCTGGVEQLWQGGYHTGDLLIYSGAKWRSVFGAPGVYDGAPVSLHSVSVTPPA
ncbi:RICIN domain-containing protein [Lentzea flava]|uniref:Ricin B lectin domain-containing protein n=1 Tax=Lentzea flava TaxID=103732 RepID=A0ABQ2UHX0_9PSEU|nr:RICIN domain-containing protein [Lentzea flava]MCP2199259.1 Ricin-type beta-trefoil lectin domain-containing protein [Lentzea flava]GGU36528.1 hypothetical protein GCM10010178_31030 [Lentzea flava]